MMGNGALKIGAAVVGGYLAGRSRKGRLLIPMALAGWAAKKGVEDRLGGSALGGVGAEVARQLQTSAGRALTARVETLTDALQQRTTAIRDGAVAAGAAGQEAAGAAGQEAGERAGEAAGQVRAQVPGAEAAGSETEPAGAEEGAEDTEERSGPSSGAGGGGRRGAPASAR
jgi:hypothetical protein